MRRLGVVLAVFALAATGAMGNASAARPPRLDGRPRAPDLAGRYAVGRTTFEVVDQARANRRLTVDVWYPAPRESVGGLPKSVINVISIPFPSPTAYAEPPVARHGVFPLVVFSHGSGGFRYQSWFLMEHLASHGFIVASPDHAGNTAADGIFGVSEPLVVAQRNRPLDVSLVISHMLRRGRTHRDLFEGHVRRSRVAVVGHSLGGFTAIANAVGWSDVPSDPRIDAIVAIAPDTSSFTDGQLAAIDVPSLWLGGTNDVSVPLDPSTTRAWSLLRRLPRWRIDIRGAGHSSFTNSCELLWILVPVVPPNRLGPLVTRAKEACGPDLLPIDVAHRVTNATTVSFLKLVLDRDVRSRAYLGRAYLGRFPVDLFR
jgi:predicted dienelactone hydrolase